MKEIIIKTQEELDKLPDGYDEYTEIHIHSSADVWLTITKTPENSKIYLWGSSHAVLWGSSHAELWGSSHAVLWGSSHAELWGSSHAELWGSSHAVLRGSSHAELWESSHAVLWESSHAVLSQNASAKIQDRTVVIEKLQHYATAICIEQKCTIKQKDKTATVIVCPRVLHDIKSFTEIYKENVTGKTMTLYKSVQPDNTDFYSGKIKYEGVVEAPDWNPDPATQCGGGLHLSPTPELTQRYNVGKILKCKVAIKDIAVYGHDITKVRCRNVEVLEEVK